MLHHVSTLEVNIPRQDPPPDRTYTTQGVAEVMYDVYFNTDGDSIHIQAYWKGQAVGAATGRCSQVDL